MFSLQFMIHCPLAYIPFSEPESLFNFKVTVRNFSASRRLSGRLSNSVILLSSYLSQTKARGSLTQLLVCFTKLVQNLVQLFRFSPKESEMNN